MKTLKTNRTNKKQENKLLRKGPSDCAGVTPGLLGRVGGAPALTRLWGHAYCTRAQASPPSRASRTPRGRRRRRPHPAPPWGAQAWERQGKGLVLSLPGSAARGPLGTRLIPGSACGSPPLPAIQAHLGLLATAGACGLSPGLHLQGGGRRSAQGVGVPSAPIPPPPHRHATQIHGRGA